MNLKVKDLPLPPCENDTVFIADSIFAGQNYSKHGFTIPIQNAAMELSDTLRIPKLDTCDSILILNLKVKDLPLPPCENDTVFIVDSIFAGQDYNQHGFTIPVQNAATVRSDTLFLKNQAACDSLVILKLRVKSKNGCPEIEIPIIFTPNSDRQNDKWEIHNINCYEHIVEIYDRFGKLLRRWKNNFTGWDGTYWGNPMPATDYWYIIYLEKNEESKSGHFTLLRR